MLNGCLEDFEPEETAIIILGDAGINFWLNKRDRQLKEELESRGFYLYCVRGNHEERPQNISGMLLVKDNNVDGLVYMEQDFPHIRYFQDYGIYIINNFTVGIIGGAYSVDKWYRLARAGVKDQFDPRYWKPKATGWFPSEQLSPEEMESAAALFKGKSVDFMFTHTCPYDWEPRDLFLSGVNQSTVDDTMEKWLQEIHDNLESYGVWCWGHFHADRIEQPFAEMFYHDIENIQDIWDRWDQYCLTGELPWYITKGPNYLQEL